MFKLKSYVVLALALILIFASSVYTVSANEYAERLGNLVDYEFAAERYLSRVDFFCVVSELFLKNQAEGAAFPFVELDIAPERQRLITSLYENGLLTGVIIGGERYLLPEEAITRQNAVTLLGRLLGETSDGYVVFTDAEEIAPYAREYAVWFVENEIVTDRPDGRFLPNDDITAGELAVLVIRTLDYINANQMNNNASVSTYAGTGSRGLLDGDVSATRFMLPYGITFSDELGLVVFDTYNNSIRKIENGRTETVAGQVTILDDYRFPQGFHVDGGFESAFLNRPTGGVFNSAGELLICDSANNAIRIIRNGRMETYSLGGATPFNTPMAIAIDKDDNVYVADTLNNCIKRIDADGTVTVIAGRSGAEGLEDGAAGMALFRSPSGIAVDDGGAVYVSDTGNHRIRKIENGLVFTVAGSTAGYDDDADPLGGFRNGAASVALFNSPAGIVLVDGTIIVADSANNMIRAIAPNGSVTTVAGTGEPGDETGRALQSGFNIPKGVFYHNGTLYIADTNNNKIKALPFGLNLE